MCRRASSAPSRGGGWRCPPGLPDNVRALVASFYRVIRRGHLAVAATILATVVIATEPPRLASADQDADVETPEASHDSLVSCQADRADDIDGSRHRGDQDANGVLDGDGEACANADVLILFDRSWSMVEWGHYDDARDTIVRIAARAGDERVNVIGFPSPPARQGNKKLGLQRRLKRREKHDPCTVGVISTPAQVEDWPTPTRGEQTPLLHAFAAAATIIAAKPRGVSTRLVVITDGFHDCDGVGARYGMEKLASLLEERLVGVRDRLLAAPEIQYVGKLRIQEADDLQAALDRLFTQPACRELEERTLNVPPTGPPVPPTPPEAPPPVPPDRLLPPQIEFVDVVAVGDADGWSCSGVLVGPVLAAARASDSFVLTARHCLPADRVAFGATTARGSDTRDVVEVIEHPDEDIDAALLRLAHQVGRRTHPHRVAGDDSPPAGHVRLVGFGADETSGRRGAGDVRVTDLLTTGWGCDARSAPTTGCLPGRELMVRGNGGLDACRGDSGGPVYEQIGCSWRLIAITSRAVASARRVCGDGGIYTRLDAIASWIQATTEEP
jgi:hypothetical protein